MSRRLKVALRKLREAKLAISEALHEDYPPGAPIRWRRNGGLYRGTVVMNCHFDRIQVRNAVTGKTYFIHAYDVE